jgi:hypothetical protein
VDYATAAYIHTVFSILITTILRYFIWVEDSVIKQTEILVGKPLENRLFTQHGNILEDNFNFYVNIIFVKTRGRHNYFRIPSNGIDNSWVQLFGSAAMLLVGRNYKRNWFHNILDEIILINVTVNHALYILLLI